MSIFQQKTARRENCHSLVNLSLVIMGSTVYELRESQPWHLNLYSGDLKSDFVPDLVHISNDQKQVGLQMVRILNAI